MSKITDNWSLKFVIKLQGTYCSWTSARFSDWNGFQLSSTSSPGRVQFYGRSLSNQLTVSCTACQITWPVSANCNSNEWYHRVVGSQGVSIIMWWTVDTTQSKMSIRRSIQFDILFIFETSYIWQMDMWSPASNDEIKRQYHDNIPYNTNSVQPGLG